MKEIYRVKVTCEYYVDVEASADDEAKDIAVNADYNIGNLQNFWYEIEDRFYQCEACGSDHYMFEDAVECCHDTLLNASEIDCIEED